MLDKRGILNRAVQCLFGELEMLDLLDLMKDLQAYTNESFPASLDGIISSNLRPRLARYISDNRDKYAAFFASDDAFQEAIASVNSGGNVSVELEKVALAHMTNISICVYRDTAGTELNQEFSAAEVPTNGEVKIACLETACFSLIAPASIPETLRVKLFPFSAVTVAGAGAVFDATVLQYAELKDLLKMMLSQAPEHLLALSTTVGLAPMTLDPFGGINLTDLRNFMRFDPIRESLTVRKDLKKVTLTTAYRLCLKSTSWDGHYDPDTLYIEIEATQFKYYVRVNSGAEKGSVRKGIILFSDLGLDNEAVTLEQLSLCLPNILAITSAREHTQVKPARIGDVSSWGHSMGKSLGVGIVGGLTAVGGVAVVGQLAAGAALASIPFVGVPLAITLIVGTMLTAAFGKHFAIQFQKELDTVSQLLSQGRYLEAAEHLDTELNRNLPVKATRNLFLSKQYQAIAHFFRGVCAIQLGKVSEAYQHYQATCNKLDRMQPSVTVFVTKLQLLNILKNCSEEQLPAGVDRTEGIKKILIELTQNYQDGFADLYWKLHRKMTEMASKFAITELLDSSEILSLNTLLLIDGLFMLEHYSNGSGAFMELFSEFFHGALLLYCDVTNPAYLDAKVQARLTIEMRSHNSAPVLLALNKFQRCALFLSIFKSVYLGRIQHDAAVASAILFIETFMLKASSLLQGNVAHIPHVPNIAQILGIEARRDSLILEQNVLIEFMIRLKREFGMPHDTVTQWLNALLIEPSPIAHIVSETTGDTMLHALVSLKLSPDQGV